MHTLLFSHSQMFLFHSEVSITFSSNVRLYIYIPQYKLQSKISNDKHFILLPQYISSYRLALLHTYNTCSCGDS